MPLSDAAKDILTLGAHSRVEDKRAEAVELQHQLAAALNERDSAITAANAAIEHLIAAKTKAVEILRGITEISKHMKAAERTVSEKTTALPASPVLSRIETVLHEADIIDHAKRGVFAGASVALGTWALTGTAGLASAGAALSASAASIAPTALIGAGTIAAGGAAAGAVALGSLVLLPAAAILAIFSHSTADKKVREIEAEMARVFAALEETRGTQLSVIHLRRRTEEITLAVDKAAAVFESERVKSLKLLYPLGWFSRTLKSIRKFFGGNYFSKNDLEILMPVINMARILADLIDRRILDEEGNLL